MPNRTRNDWESPCYQDIGSKLFPEAPEGQGLDLTDPNTRDQALTKHFIREGEKQGFKPVKVWLFSHRDALRGNGDAPVAGAGGPDNDPDDFYGDGGGGQSLNAREDGQGKNFYNEMPTKVYSGPYIITAEYMPVAAETALLDFGYEKEYKDVFNFLIDDAKKILGRVPYNGDLIQRFDGKILEITKSFETGFETWEALYQTCAAVNTNKDDRQFFRSQE
jgi:hypothetical protein